jgi:hypothetical protein
MASLFFGKWKGVDLPQVPTDYLLWVIDNCRLSTGIHAAVALELSHRGIPIPAPPLTQPPECQRCRRKGRPSGSYTCTWQEQRNGERRIRASCGTCWGFLTFLPERDPYLSMANSWSSDTSVLDVLVQLEALDVGLLSDGDTCWIAWEDQPRVPGELQNRLRECCHRLARLMGRNVPRTLSLWGMS